MDLTTRDLLLIILLLSFAFIFLIILLYRIRRMMQGRLDREEKWEDSGFNRVNAAQGIVNNLRAKGIEVSDAQAMIKEARDHLDRGEEGPAIALAQRAKSLLAQRLADHEETLRRIERGEAPLEDEEKGEMTRLDKKSTGEQKDDDEEKAVKEFVNFDESKFEEKRDNYLPAKFTIRMAGEEIDRCASAGKDVSAAMRYLEQAEAAMGKKDFKNALALANKAKKAAHGEDTGAELAPEPAAEEVVEEQVMLIICPECQAELTEGDNFCPKCGVKIEIVRELNCPGCGAPVGEGDRFCRKCGEKLA